MGDVYWMTAILIIQAIISAIICAVLTLRCESVVEEDVKKEETVAAES